MKGRRSSSLSCGAWKTLSWLSMAGMRDTARQDNMIGLCLFLSSMADSKSAYTTTGAGISYRWLVHEMQACFFIHKLVTDYDHLSVCDVPSLHDFGQLFEIQRSHRTCTSRFLRDLVILCITLTKDAMLEISQVLEQKHQSIESGYHRNADTFNRSTVVGQGIVNDHRGEQVVVQVRNLQVRWSHQKWIHLDYLTISSDINHIRSIEQSR